MTLSQLYQTVILVHLTSELTIASNDANAQCDDWPTIEIRYAGNYEKRQLYWTKKIMAIAPIDRPQLEMGPSGNGVKQQWAA